MIWLADIMTKSQRTEEEDKYVVDILESIEFFKQAKFTRDELHKISLKCVIERHKPMKILYKK